MMLIVSAFISSMWANDLQHGDVRTIQVRDYSFFLLFLDAVMFVFVAVLVLVVV